MAGGMGVSQAWGAAADGSTDDTAAVQLVINQAQGLYIPPNTTLVCSQLTITAPYFKIWGGGRLLLKAGSNSPLIFADGTAAALNLMIENVRFDGNASNQTAAAPLIQLRNAAYTRITDSWIVNSAGDGLAIENYGASGLSDEINIANSFIFSNAGNGIRLFSTASGGSIQATGDHVITHCHINYNGGCGILLQGAASCLVAHNNVLTNTLSGIEGRGISGELNLSRCNFIGNMARNNGGSGIYIHADGGNGAERIQIVGGQCHYNNGSAGSSNGIDVFDTAGLVIVGVYSGDADFTFRQPYGIQLARDTGVSIVGCYVLDNATSGILPNGVAYKAFGNQGIADSVASSSGTDAQNPLSYNSACGDGVTDATSAIVSAIAAGGLRLPSGSIFLTSPIALTGIADGFTIYGGGRLKLKTGSSAALLSITTANDVRIADVRLDGNSATGSNAVIALSSVTECSLRGLLIVGGYGPGVSLSGSSNVRIGDCNAVAQTPGLTATSSTWAAFMNAGIPDQEGL